MNSIFKIVYAIPRGPLSYNFEAGTILELVKRGGFSREYYIKHDKNSEFVKNNKESLIEV